jgi:hypothetical protein
MLRIIKRAPWIVAGALAAWLFDGTNGEERRRRLRARADELLHGGNAPRSPIDVDVPVERAA